MLLIIALLIIVGLIYNPTLTGIIVILVVLLAPMALRATNDTVSGR